MGLFDRQAGMKPHNKRAHYQRLPLIIAASYAVVSGLWIVFSDRFVSAIASGYSNYQLLQTLKGWLFVSVTAVLLYLALRSAYTHIVNALQRATHSEQRLHLALSSAGGGIWDRDLTRDREVYFSPSLKALIGLTSSAPLSLDEWSERIHPDDNAWIVTSTMDAVASRGRQVHDVRYRIRGADGNYRWVHSRGRVICDDRGEPVRMIGIILDVTEKFVAEERIRQLTHYDAVSGLANCGTFFQQLNDELAKAKRTGKVIAVAQIEISDFNELLDELGPKQANKIIQAVGQHLSRLVGPDGLAGRLSQDAFVIATAPQPSSFGVHTVINNIAILLDRPVLIGKRRVRPSFSIGAALGPQDGESASVLVANSHRALTKPETAGRDGVQWFAEGMDVESRTRTQRLRDLRVSVKRRQLECHFQPIVGLSASRTIGFEALARWNRPAEGLVPPDQFIGLAEESGIIHAIGEEILWQACREARKWNMGDERNAFVAVNVSPRQLDDPDFPALIERVLSQTGLPPERLELEVTENALIHDFDAARARLVALRNLGISIAMDDFGTGYSSLSTLSRLPFTRLKIDRSFVATYGSDSQTTAIVDATLLICDAMGLDITAEGIETAAQAASLRGRGIQAAQGFYFSRPVPADMVAGIIDQDWPIEASEDTGSAIIRRHTA